MTVALFDQLNASVINVSKLNKTKLSLTGLDGFLDKFRSVKTAEEIALIGQAAQIADKSFAEATSDFKGGISEKELAWRIEMAIPVWVHNVVRSKDTGENTMNHRVRKDLLNIRDFGQNIIPRISALFKHLFNLLVYTLMAFTTEKAVKLELDYLIYNKLKS